MKILFLAHRVPYPPNRGDRIRSYQILRFLAARHEVHLACTSDEPWTTSSAEHLAELCPRVFISPPARQRRWLSAAASFIRGRSATQGLFHSRRLGQTIDDWAATQNYDAVFAYCSSMAPYLLRPGLRHLPAVVDLVDVDSLKWMNYSAGSSGPKRLLYAIEADRVAKLERMCDDRAAALTVVSENEAADLLRSCPSSDCHIVPNGVDLNYFAFEPETANSAMPGCVFVGAMDYPPNVDAVCWFVRDIWPAIRERYPMARFQIVGHNPVSAVDCLRGVEGIEIMGAVPDVRKFLYDAQVVVAPLRIARGVQNKVLEAMACGRAVIASTAALTGLHAVDGRETCRADTVEEWKLSVLSLLADSRRRAQLAHAARRYVENRHDWPTCLRPLEKIFHDVAALGSGPHASVSCTSMPTAAAKVG
jgi:sugar transferase (PEP-CTERM/EpsH1 system associated)